MEREIRILLLEDSLLDAEFAERELRRAGLSFNALRVDTREAFVEQLEEFQPDLVISDYLLPSYDGLTALALTRERFPELPFILVSGYIGEERAAEALKNGATDFVLKANVGTRLTQTVQRAMREVEANAALKGTGEMLRQAQKLEALGQLTGGLAHDFNNLLGIIIGNLDLLQDMLKENPEADELRREALDASLRGAELTRHLLAFARRQPLQPKRIEINKLVTDTTNLLSHTLGEAIEIALSTETDLWFVVADPAQLDSALTNLCVNARDAMPRGGRLTISTSNTQLDADYAAENPEVSPGEYVLLEVTDAGTGMPPNVLSRVFEPFFTTKETGKGTGLGLSMVFGFVKQSGGHIKVYSEVGVGTVVRIYLPRAKQSGDAADSAEPFPSLPMAVGREVVLAVEDNEKLRRVLVRQLEDLGYSVLEAADGKSALEVLRGSSDINLLLTDVVMPGGLDGRELAQAASQIRPGLKVLFTSGFPQTAFGTDNLIAECDLLLSKPYRKQDLARMVREALAI